MINSVKFKHKGFDYYFMVPDQDHYEVYGERLMDDGVTAYEHQLLEVFK